MRTRSAVGWLGATLVFLGVGTSLLVPFWGPQKTYYGIVPTFLGASLLVGIMVLVFVRGLVRGRKAEFRANFQASEGSFLTACLLASVGSCLSTASDWLALDILGSVLAGSGALAGLYLMIKAVPAGDPRPTASEPTAPRPSAVPD